MKPVKCWIEKERIGAEIVSCLTIILKTAGCRWAQIEGCTMCGFKRDTSPNITQDEILHQISYALKKYTGFDMIKIFTSGSFFDEREISSETRNRIFQMVENCRRVVVESRPEFITSELIESLDTGFELQVSIGLETANDELRQKAINKGFLFRDYMNAVKILKEHGIGIKTYLLLKPPGITEKEAIEDAITSAYKIKREADVISLNLCNVQSGTIVEKLWKAGLYRPPWLWSAVKVLEDVSKVGIDIISDPVGAGSYRGPHNCKKCSRDVANAIRMFSLEPDRDILSEIRNTCDCYELWETILKYENFAGIVEV